MILVSGRIRKLATGMLVAVSLALSTGVPLVAQTQTPAEEPATERTPQQTNAVSFEPVRELVALGELTEARAKLIELVKGNPPHKVPEDLRFLHGGRWSWWRAVREWVFGWFPTVLEIAAGLFLLGLLVWWGVRGLRALERTNGSRQGKSGDFLEHWEGDPWVRGPVLLVGLLAFLAGVEGMTTCCLPGLSRWLGPGAGFVLAFVGLLLVVFFFYWATLIPLRRGLMIEALQGKVENAPDSDSLAAMIRGQVLTLARSQEDLNFTLQTAAPEKVSIPTVQAVTPAAQGFLAALQYLTKWLPRKPYKVTGALHEPCHVGPGVTLHFLKGEQALATTTLHQGDYLPEGHQASKKGSPEAYELLADLAAVWILFQLQQDSRWAREDDLELLGTKDWQAFAYFQAGVRAFEAEDYKASEYCFEMALIRDREFPAARFNLFKTLYFSQPDTSNKEKTPQGKMASDLRKKRQEKLIEKVLCDLRKEMKRERCEGVQGDPQKIWQTLKAATSEPEESEQYATEVDLTKLENERFYIMARYAQLVFRMKAIFQEADGQKKSSSSAPTDCCRGDTPPHEDQKPQDQEADWWKDAHRFARDLRQLGRSPRVRKHRSELWHTARDYAEALQPALALALFKSEKFIYKRICWLDKWRPSLCEKAYQGIPLFGYNLACWLVLDNISRPSCKDEKTSKRSQESCCENARVATALQVLERSIRLDPRRRESAKTDPDFDTVQHCARFKEIVRDSPPPPLATLQIVGEKHARALAAEGIETVEDLLLATVRQDQRRQLADKLGVSRKLALDWARLAELGRVRSLEVATIDLLAKGGVDRLETLAGLQQRDMEELLEKLGKSHESELPFELDDLVAWMDQANQQLPSMVPGGV